MPLSPTSRDSIKMFSYDYSNEFMWNEWGALLKTLQLWYGANGRLTTTLKKLRMKWGICQGGFDLKNQIFAHSAWGVLIFVNWKPDSVHTDDHK